MNLITSKHIIEVYDPRKGENLSIEAHEGKLFSSLENGFIAINAYREEFFKGHPKKFGPIKAEQIIKASLLQKKGLGFVCISPINKRVKIQESITLEQVNELSGSLLGYFEIDPDNIEKIMEYREKPASYEEWIIGNCREKFERPSEKRKWLSREIAWNIDFLLSQAEKIDCLFWYNGEMDESIILTRIFSGLDAVLKEAGIPAQ